MEKHQVKIAIVEDDANLRLLVSQRIASEGYQVLEAADGTSGEELILRTTTYCFIRLDASG